MNGSILVKLTPSPDDELERVRRARIELVPLGPEPSKLAADTPTKAQLVFFGAFLEKARRISEPEFTEFATYEGVIERLGEDGKGLPITFRCNPEAEIEYVQTDEREPELIRRLGLLFGAEFDGAPEAPESASELRLPEEPDGARYFELGVALRIGDALESDRVVNDRLDVPLPPFLQRLVLEWPEGHTERVPSGLTILVEAGSVKRTLIWEQGQVTGDMRRFVFEGVPLEPVSLFVALGEDIIQVWDEQDLTDEEREPDWLGWLEEFLSDVGPEDEPGQEVNQSDHLSAELDGRDRTPQIRQLKF